jgi:TolB-like protein/Flp pilus assembly protein TadD
MNVRSFFSELKRRHVYNVAVAYVVVAWLFIQVATQVFPFFSIPNWVVRLVVLLSIVGFPIAVVCAWAFEMTPEGIKLEGEIDRRIIRKAGRKLTALIVIVAAVAAGVTVFRFLHSQQGIEVAKQPPLAVAIESKSIAVLPFENLSEEKANAYFADGMQDEILTNLARIADLKVISRTSVMQYKTDAQRNLREIGQQLGVAFLLEGRVQRAANRVRVNAQLIDSRSEANVWAQTYDRDLADVFAIQSEIAKAIAGQLQAKLSPTEKNAIEQQPTADLIAFDQYSRAKTLLLTTAASAFQNKNFLEAIQLLESATARDPAFHAAYCQLVFAHDSLYAGDHVPSRLAAAEAALQTASQLQPDSPETHLARGWHLYYALRDSKGALAELEIARRGLANDARIFATVGYILRRQGKHEEGLRALEQAVALDPRNLDTLIQLSISYNYLRRYAQEAALLDRAREIAPEDTGIAISRALVDFRAQANPEPLSRFIEQLRRKRPALLGEVADSWLFCALVKRDWPAAEQALAALPQDGWVEGAVRLGRHFGEGLLARSMYDEPRARAAFAAARLEQEQIVRTQEDYRALCVLGLIDAALGNKEAALQEGRRAVELLPTTKDAMDGAALAVSLAQIYAWAGEKDLAIEQIAAVEHFPNDLSYGDLKLHPDWDSLRGDPRFEKIVASLAPKPASAEHP